MEALFGEAFNVFHAMYVFRCKFCATNHSQIISLCAFAKHLGRTEMEDEIHDDSRMQSCRVC